jgi:hypothetical protein
MAPVVRPRRPGLINLVILNFGYSDLFVIFVCDLDFSPKLNSFLFNRTGGGGQGKY